MSFMKTSIHSMDISVETPDNIKTIQHKITKKGWLGFGLHYIEQCCNHCVTPLRCRATPAL